MNGLIAVSTFSRYEYFVSCVRAIEKATFSEEFVLFISVDGTKNVKPVSEIKRNETLYWHHSQLSEDKIRSHENIIQKSLEIQKSSIFKDVVVKIFRNNYGTWLHKTSVINSAFDYSKSIDFVICLEDDIVLSKDGLAFFKWMNEYKKNDHISCWSPYFTYDASCDINNDIKTVKETSNLYTYETNDWAFQWGWSLTRKTWQKYGNSWSGRDSHLAIMMKHHKMNTTYPVLSRCNNIGTNGVNMKNGNIVHTRSITSDNFDIGEKTNYTYMVKNMEHTRIGITRVVCEVNRTYS